MRPEITFAPTMALQGFFGQGGMYALLHLTECSGGVWVLGDLVAEYGCCHNIPVVNGVAVRADPIIGINSAKEDAVPPFFQN